MSTRTPRRTRRPGTALVHQPNQLGPREPGDPPTPLAVFLASCSPGSRATMRSRLNAAARILVRGATAETFPWEALDHLAVVGVLATLAEQKAAPATINLTRAALRKMARILFRLRIMDVEERLRIDDLEHAKGSRLPRGRALTKRELRKLFAACASEEHAAGRRDAALIACLYGGGLRREEASTLAIADVNADGTLRVQGKGGRERLQPIGDDAARAIAVWIKVRGDNAGPLFVTVDKAGKISRRRLRGAAIEWTVKRLAMRAAIARTSPHDLRRTFVTALLESGEDLATVSKAAGHQSVTTTAIYDRRGEKAVAEAVAKLPVPFGR